MKPILNIINELPPYLKWYVDNNISGSTFVYASTNKYGNYDELGSVPYDIGSYSLTGSYNCFKIKVNSNNTFSLYSNIVSIYNKHYLTSPEDVRTVYDFDLTDDEIWEAIEQTDNEIFSKYGNELVGGKTYTLVEYSTNSGNLRTRYRFSLSKEPTYRFDALYLGSTKIDPQYYTVDLNNSYITINENILKSNTSERLIFKFVPQVYSLLSKYKTALHLMLSHDILRGEDVVANKITNLKEVISNVEKTISYPTILLSSQVPEESFIGDYIKQDPYIDNE